MTRCPECCRHDCDLSDADQAMKEWLARTSTETTYHEEYLVILGRRIKAVRECQRAKKTLAARYVRDVEWLSAELERTHAELNRVLALLQCAQEFSEDGVTYRHIQRGWYATNGVDWAKTKGGTRPKFGYKVPDCVVFPTFEEAKAAVAKLRAGATKF